MDMDMDTWIGYGYMEMETLNGKEEVKNLDAKKTLFS